MSDTSCKHCSHVTLAVPRAIGYAIADGRAKCLVVSWMPEGPIVLMAPFGMSDASIQDLRETAELWLRTATRKKESGETSVPACEVEHSRQDPDSKGGEG